MDGEERGREVNVFLSQESRCYHRCIMSHESHTNAICKSIFLQLDKISRVCPFLSVCATEKLMSAFVLSQWDYCSSLFVHLPNRQLYKPQRTWNNVAWTDQTMNPFCTCSHWLEDEQLCYCCPYPQSTLSQLLASFFLNLLTSDERNSADDLLLLWNHRLEFSVPCSWRRVYVRSLKTNLFMKYLS